MVGSTVCQENAATFVDALALVALDRGDGSKGTGNSRLCVTHRKFLFSCSNFRTFQAEPRLARTDLDGRLTRSNSDEALHFPSPERLGCFLGDWL